MNNYVSWQRFVFWLVICAIMASFGAIYTLFFLSDAYILSGAIYGLSIGMPAVVYERGVFLRGVYNRIRRFSTPTYLLCQLAVYLVIISFGNAFAGAIAWMIEEPNDTILESIVLSPQTLLYSLAVSALVTSVLRVRDIIDSRVFGNLLLGRYHRPIEEDRVFLFLDLVGSTTFAERNGDLKAQEYLGRLFAAFAEPVSRYGGIIDDYIGDSAIVSWPLKRGADNGNCVRCLLDIIDTIENDAWSWNEDFGEVPKLRAALHAGRIVTAEVGVDRHKITYFGDAINTTARIEGLTRILGVPFLISEDLLVHVRILPDRMKTRNLGDHPAKGRDQVITIHALDRISN